MSRRPARGTLLGVGPDQAADGDDLALLASICEHAAACLVAIEASEKIERNYKDTIQALVHALEARDEYTADHPSYHGGEASPLPAKG